MERRSSIISIGLTFHSAPVELREKLAVPEAEWPRAMAELCAYPHVEEAAVLSTCNRMELYVVGLSFHRAVREVEDWLCRAGGVALGELRPHLFLLRDGDAAAHLLRVAAGLDSMVLGEGQILAQVKQVGAAGQGCPGFGRTLHALFKAAVTAGKRVRAETSIAAGAVSVSGAAAELAATQFPGGDLSRAGVAVLGAGKMARLLARHLAAKGVRRLTVVNRSPGRAAALADDCPQLEVEARPLGELRDAVARADVVFTASSAEEVVVTRALLAGLPPPPSGAGDGLRRFFDIAVPRNVAGDLTPARDAARVFNVDDLRDVVSAAVDERGRAAAEAEELLVQEQAGFEAWRQSLGAVPTIKALRGKAEAIRAAELAKTLSRLGDGLSPKQRAAVEDCTRAIVNKLLHGPMAALRGGAPGADCADPERTLADIKALERLFDLSDAAQEAALAAARGRK